MGDDLDEGRLKWQGGALATDGVIYCIPAYNNTQILAIDPFKEFSMTLQNNFIQHPQELGHLFAKDDEKYDETFYKSALRKFGIEKVFELIEECAPLDAEWADTHDNNVLPLFMVAASCENCAASVIYYFLRRNVHACIVGK